MFADALTVSKWGDFEVMTHDEVFTDCVKFIQKNEQVPCIVPEDVNRRAHEHVVDMMRRVPAWGGNNPKSIWNAVGKRERIGRPKDPKLETKMKTKVKQRVTKEVRAFGRIASLTRTHGTISNVVGANIRTAFFSVSHDVSKNIKTSTLRVGQKVNFKVCEKKTQHHVLNKYHFPQVTDVTSIM